MQVRSNAKAFIFYRLYSTQTNFYPLRGFFIAPLNRAFYLLIIFFNPNGLSLQRRFERAQNRSDNRLNR